MPTSTTDQENEKLNPARNVGQDDFDKKIDQSYGPRDQASTPGSTETRDSVSDNLSSRENDAASGSSSDNFSESSYLQSMERSGDAGWKDSTSQPSSFGGKNAKLSLNRKKAAIFGGGAGIVGVIIALVFGFVQSLILVHYKELADSAFAPPSVSVLGRLGDYIFMKMLTSDPNDPTKGCTGVPVRCRYTGITNQQKEKFERRTGMKIITEGVERNGKLKVKRIQFSTQSGATKTLNPRDFKREYKKSSLFRKSFHSFNNSRVGIWNDVAASKFYALKAVYRGKLKVGDDEGEKDPNKSLRNRVRNMIKDRVSKKDYTNSLSVAAVSNTGDESELKNSRAAGEVGDEVNKLADEAKSTDPSKKISLKAKGGPIISAIQSVCLVRSLMSTAALGAKVYAAEQLIRFSMLYMVASEQQQAGDADGSSAKALGDLSSTLTSTNPETGLTAADSIGYQSASGGKVSPDFEQIKKFMLGWGLGSTISSITNFPAYKGVCRIVSSVLSIIPSPPLPAWLEKYVNTVVAGAMASLALVVAGKIIDGNEVGDEVGNAYFAGASASYSLNSGRMHGMYPLQKDTAVSVLKDANKIYAERNKFNTKNNFDMNEQNSFSKKFAFLLYPSIIKFSSLSLLPNNILNFSRSALNGSGWSNTAFAKDRKSMCVDDTYDEQNIKTDDFCNVIYSYDSSNLGNKEDSEYEPGKVLDYMLSNSYIDSSGEPLGEYDDFIGDCIETDAAIDTITDTPMPDECYLPPEKTDNPEKFHMFRQYYMATTIDDQFNDRMGSETSNSNTTPNTTTDSESDVKQLAQQILDNPKVSYPYTDKTGTTAKQVLKGIVRTGKGVVNTPDVSYRSVEVNPKMLQAILEYAQDREIGLNTLTNADHSSTSNHYKGIAVDLACTPALDRAAFESIASKYGGKNNGEVCPGDLHWHYDFYK